MAVEKTKQTKAASVKPERLIYLGPNLIQYGLTRYAVYKGGLPMQQMAEAFHCWPLIKCLFVPPKQLVKAEQAIQTPGTPQNEAFKQVMKGRES